jgi:hypothetical protein
VVQRTLDDMMHQLESKDGLVAHLTSQLGSKDKQLASLMDLLSDDTNKVSGQFHGLLQTPTLMGRGVLYSLPRLCFFVCFLVRFFHKLDPIYQFPFVGIWNNVKYESSLHYGITGSLV